MKKQATPLTEKEKAVLEFIENELAQKGISPSYQEIRDHFGFASFNSVQNYLKQLSQKGYVSIPANQKRAIQVLMSANAVQKQVLAGRQQKVASNTESVDSARLPFLGKVAAGRPLEAFHYDEFLEVPRSMIRDPRKSFALKVVGQSMIEDGILDGDVILIQKQSSASNGEMIVATVENESTVKRFFAKPGAKEVELRPSNSTMKSMFYPAQNVEIQGIVVGLIRKF